MSYEYVVDLLEYDFSACEVVRTWSEVWPSLDQIESATWDMANCTVECSEAAPVDGCCDYDGADDYGADGYALEYTTYNFQTCEVTGVQCEALPRCMPPEYTTGCCECDAIPRFWVFDMPAISGTTPTPVGEYVCEEMPSGEIVMEMLACRGDSPLLTVSTTWGSLIRYAEATYPPIEKDVGYIPALLECLTDLHVRRYRLTLGAFKVFSSTFWQTQEMAVYQIDIPYVGSDDGYCQGPITLPLVSVSAGCLCSPIPAEITVEAY